MGGLGIFPQVSASTKSILNYSYGKFGTRKLHDLNSYPCWMQKIQTLIRILRTSKFLWWENRSVSFSLFPIRISPYKNWPIWLWDIPTNSDGEGSISGVKDSSWRNAEYLWLGRTTIQAIVPVSTFPVPCIRLVAWGLRVLDVFPHRTHLYFHPGTQSNLTS